MLKWLLVLLFFVPSIVNAEIGEISELRGNGEILRKDQTGSLIAKTSLDILSYDDVRTGNGRIGITFLDDSIIRLTEHSKIVIDEYIYDPDPSKSKLALNMASGTARFITGALGRINKENIRITTPTATIAIRGTDFTTTVDELGRSLVILLPDANGISSGEITVDSFAGTVVLNKPFQATMVSVSEGLPTKPITLKNMSLNFIDNLLIVAPPNEVKQAVEEQQSSADNVLDIDLLEENDLDEDLLDEDELEEDITRLDIDFLSVDFLTDLLAALDEVSKKEDGASGELDGMKIEGIVAGYDKDAQTYTFVEGEIFSLVRQVENTIDLELDKDGAYNIDILSASKSISIKTNGGGESEIIINQSD
jgi:hypothetical protein|tara:strand:+ start:28 stop:1122 length:1095 start_codon:yes stop_codon:yes gene_type:complete